MNQRKTLPDLHKGWVLMDIPEILMEKVTLVAPSTNVD